MTKWLVVLLLALCLPASAQIAPGADEVQAYRGLHAAAAKGDVASVANDVAMLKLALAGGGRASNITSPYEGTALIAAAHLGHDDVVRTLIAAKAPLNHVNNLGWTALIESIVLGDGGTRHVACLTALVKAGANINLADRGGSTPLTLARGRGYSEMAKILEQAGAR